VECDVIEQVDLYISKDLGAFVFRILQSKPDPEDGSSTVL
jgi:hypothetical protein